MGKIYTGQIGLLIELDTLIDLTNATTLEIKYRRPDRTTGAFTATADGTKIVYTTTSAEDLPEAGETWKLQAHAAGTGWDFLGETVDFVVTDPFE